MNAPSALDDDLVWNAVNRTNQEIPVGYSLTIRACTPTQEVGSAPTCVGSPHPNARSRSLLCRWAKRHRLIIRVGAIC